MGASPPDPPPGAREAGGLTDAGTRPKPSRAPFVLGGAALALAYAVLWGAGGVTPAAVLPVWWMVLVGLFAASLANATGAGGGVVFVPAFTLIAMTGGPALTTPEVVALSLLIQCFGMSAGSLSWLWRLRGVGGLTLGARVSDLLRVLIPALGAGLPALWATQALAQVDAATLLLLFKGLSLGLGLLLLASLRWPERAARLRLGDLPLLLGAGALGGVGSALFSVGIGELLALALLLRGFSLALSVASAVIASAVLALAAAPAALAIAGPHLAIVAAAAPGVLVGGWLGRRIALRLGPRRLKRLCGVWIVGSSVALIASAL